MRDVTPSPKQTAVDDDRCKRRYWENAEPFDQHETAFERLRIGYQGRGASEAAVDRVCAAVVEEARLAGQRINLRGNDAWDTLVPRLSVPRTLPPEPDTARFSRPPVKSPPRTALPTLRPATHRCTFRSAPRLPLPHPLIMARRQILENRAVQQMNENLPNTPARLGKRKSVNKPTKDRAFHPSPRSAALLSNAQAVVQAAIIRKKLDLGYKTNLKLGLSPRRPKPAETTILDALFGPERELIDARQQHRAEQAAAAEQWPEWVSDALEVSDTGVYVPILGMVVKSLPKESESPVPKSGAHQQRSTRQEGFGQEAAPDLANRLVCATGEDPSQAASRRQCSLQIEAPTLASDLKAAEDMPVSSASWLGGDELYLCSELAAERLDQPASDNLDFLSESDECIVSSEDSSDEHDEQSAIVENPPSRTSSKQNLLRNGSQQSLGSKLHLESAEAESPEVAPVPPVVKPPPFPRPVVSPRPKTRPGQMDAQIQATVAACGALGGDKGLALASAVGTTPLPIFPVLHDPN